MIRPLDPVADAEAILDLYCRTADYVDIESGREPSSALVAEDFSDAPPNSNSASSVKLGRFEEGRLVGIADMAFGYPGPRDAYLGLMLLAQEARGRGLGAVFFRHLEDAACVRGARRLLLAVLEANPRGRAFWERQSFGSPRITPPAAIGDRTHVRIRVEKSL